MIVRRDRARQMCEIGLWLVADTKGTGEIRVRDTLVRWYWGISDGSHMRLYGPGKVCRGEDVVAKSIKLYDFKGDRLTSRRQ